MGEADRQAETEIEGDRQTDRQKKTKTERY